MSKEDRDKYENINIKTMQRDGLERSHLGAYSVGHVYNDLCATMWFSYLLYFLQNVIGLGSTESGMAILAG